MPKRRGKTIDGLPQLTLQAEAHWEAYHKARLSKQRADKRAKKAKEQADEALAAITAEMAGATLGQLPDGRLIQRVKHERNWPALPPKTISWEELQLATV